jgi:3-hydroxyacyl-CoA dehydrogenase/enoyl-CoA hydratase/3-hydroxybutyryl-CoA epimerase
MFEGLRFTHWRHELGPDGILILTLDRHGESANSLGREVLEELGRLVERIAIDPPKGVVIRSGKPGSFIVGADIREFEQYAAKDQVLDAIERGHRVFNALAALPCPTAAAIHGACMGGGTELALACRYRAASNAAATRLGLPEVKLGIQPGWGGSARLPHLIGSPNAFDLMLTGRAASASNARALGLVDSVVDESALLDTAKSLVLRRPQRPLGQRALAWATNVWPARQLVALMIRSQTAAKADPKHYPAPFAMIELWRRHGGSVGTMLRAEPRSVAKLAATPTAKNLVRVYFLQEALKNLGAKDAHDIRHVHVVGAGVMGGDIAAWCALQGFTVSLQDREMKYVQPALDRAQELFAKRLKTEPKITEARSRLVADVESARVPDADLVIEAIFENIEAKQALYAELEPRLKSTALLASNTSSIPLTTLAEKLADKRRFVGLHYFNPVALMPLVEIVRHPDIAKGTVDRLLSFARAIDKLPVPVATSPGFLVNRILMPYMLEAMTCYTEGVPGPVLDRAAKKFGMPMGPIELADTVGLDVAASVGKILAEFLGLEVPRGLDAMLQAGKRGRKDGQGFYAWQDGKPVKPEVDPQYKPPEDLTDRIILPMINESVACLHEGVVDSEDLLDAGVIFGTGFAPFRGGPCRYLRETGATDIKRRLEQLAQKHGKRFAPKPGWDRFG